MTIGTSSAQVNFTVAYSTKSNFVYYPRISDAFADALEGGTPQ
jgi:hypothetical protein